MDGSDQRISMTSASIFHLGCPNIVLDPARVANPYSSPLNHSVSMSFVKLSIFGTSFEVGFRLLSFIELTPDLRSPQDMSISNPLAWVSHLSPLHPPNPAHPLQGAFGLVWYVSPSSFPPARHTCPTQFRKGSTYRRIRRYQENHEAIQYTRPLETHLSRAETSQAHPTRKRPSPLTPSAFFSPCQFPLSLDYQP